MKEKIQGGGKRQPSDRGGDGRRRRNREGEKRENKALRMYRVEKVGEGRRDSAKATTS